jgi:hypothetical protein
VTLLWGLVIGGGVLFGVILMARWYEARRWAASLVCWQLRLPRGLTSKEVASWLAQIGAHTVPPRFSVLPVWPVVVEIEATHDGIDHRLLVPKSRQAAVLASLRASLPGVRVEEVAEPTEPPPLQAGVELRLTSQTTPLQDRLAATAANGALAAMQPLPGGAVVRMQWLFAGVRARKPHGGTETDALRWLLGTTPDEREALRDERQKQRAPLLVATGRIAAAGPTREHAFAAIHRVVGAVRVLEAPGAHFLWRLVPSWLARRRVAERRMPLLAWPITLNTLEAVGVVAMPLDGAALPGLQLGGSRHVPPSPETPRSGVVIGESTYPGTSRPLALRPRDRLMHTYVLGPSGTGKSTLLANMALQDIEAGYSVVVLDPKADLIEELLARFPDDRQHDLLLLDPSDTVRPVGFNPLQAKGGEHGRELAAETIAHVLRDIYREYWGPRTDDLLRAALQSLVHVPAPNGESFTLAEVPELLTNASLRSYVTRHPQLAERWRTYWLEYGLRSEADQLAMVGPVLNKLRAFTHRTSLRLVLGQANGIDLGQVFTKRKTLLVPLSQGRIGTEAATLIGSLFVGSLWQATLRRASVPAERRRPVFAYLDEFQNLVRLTDDVSDMLAQARGLGLGLILAHQYARQLPEAARAAVLGTARTQIFFQTEFDDAQLVAKRAAPVLSADDLMGLGTYEMVARLAVNGRTGSPVTGRTLPLPLATRDPAELRRLVAKRDGRPRREVEAALRARCQPVVARPKRLGEVRLDEGGAL